MEKKLPEQWKLFECFNQPAFAAQDERIAYSNGAAQAVMLLPEMPLDVVLGTQIEEYRSMAENEVLVLEVQCVDGMLPATVRRVQGYDLFVVDRAVNKENMKLCLRMAGQMRKVLQKMFLAGSDLFRILEEQENDEIQAEVASVNHGMYELLRMAENLSDASQYLTAQRSLYLEKTDLKEYFDALFAKAQDLCQSAGYTLTVSGFERRVNGMLDQKKVELAFYHLLSNAIKFTRPDGRLYCSVRKQGQQLCLVMTDSGEGISEEVLLAAFSQYENGALLAEPRKGMGFGLAIVRQIAALHGGTAMLKRLEQGTCIMMTMDVGQTQQAQVHSPFAAVVDKAETRDAALIALSDVLPDAVYNPIGVD